MSATIEIDDGVVIFRDGPISITVKASEATVFNAEAGLPAKRVPVSDEFWEAAKDHLDYPPEKPTA